jgi:hypothetical protein
MERYETSINYPGSSSENGVVREIVQRKSITEDQFMEAYEEIRSAARASRGWENWNRSKHQIPLVKEKDFPVLPYAAYNSWAKPKNMSDNLKLFRKLRGAI